MFFKLVKGAGIIDFMKPVGEKQLLVLKICTFLSLYGRCFPLTGFPCKIGQKQGEIALKPGVKPLSAPYFRSIGRQKSFLCRSFSFYIGF